jgi:hypothetical protein
MTETVSKMPDHVVHDLRGTGTVEGPDSTTRREFSQSKKFLAFMSIRADVVRLKSGVR